MKSSHCFVYALSLACMICITVNADIIPFDSEHWQFSPGSVIEEHCGRKVLILGVKPPGAPFAQGNAILKGINFHNGVIEYDLSFGKTRTFAGVKFHMQSSEDFEKFYMRAHQSGNPDANQYIPVYHGVESWQLYYGRPYSVPVTYEFHRWIHVKLVVNDNLADIYIKDMKSPILTVALKREEKNGSVGLWTLNISGPARFSNFSIKPMDQAPIKGRPVPEKTAKPGTIMDWQISAAFDGHILEGKTQLPDSATSGLRFTPLHAEQTGLANLARIQGVKKGHNTVYAKLIINAEKALIKRLDFGFSDAVKVYLNGQLLYQGHDEYQSRDYRFLGTIGFYDSLYLALRKGRNELLFAVTEGIRHNGWGLQARITNTDDISLGS